MTPTGISMAIESVSPEIATWWLEMNLHNRNLNKIRVTQLAKDMREGLWVINGEPIQFDREGRLINGQHRLHAIVASGVTLQMLVVRGLAPQAQDTIDIGANRSMTAILTLNGFTQAMAQAAIAVADYRYANHRDVVWTQSHMPSRPQQLQMINERHNEYADGIRVGLAGLKAVGAHRLAYGFLSVLAYRASTEDKWSEFHEGVISGVGLQQDDPRLTLRNLYARRTRGQTGGSWGQQSYIAVGIKAYNAYLQGRSIKVLHFRRDELPMPTIAAV